LETDLTQRDLPPLPFIQQSVNPNWITGTTRAESPVLIQRGCSPEAVEVTGFPPRPFLPEHIYLSATIPSRNRDKQLAFIRHCCYLQQDRSSIEFTHTLTELHLLTPSPAIFTGFLWRYKIYINQNGIVEDYWVIVTDNQGMHLETWFTVFHSWDRRGFSVDIDAWVIGTNKTEVSHKVQPNWNWMNPSPIYNQRPLHDQYLRRSNPFCSIWKWSNLLLRSRISVEIWRR